jgi:hypothetical protein
MLDSREGVCAGQARFEYPATSALFSNKLRSTTGHGRGGVPEGVRGSGHSPVLVTTFHVAASGARKYEATGRNCQQSVSNDASRSLTQRHRATVDSAAHLGGYGGG